MDKQIDRHVKPFITSRGEFKLDVFVSLPEALQSTHLRVFVHCTQGTSLNGSLQLKSLKMSKDDLSFTYLVSDV